MARSVAVLSDVHGVLPALDAALAAPAVAAADLVVVTGDHTWGPDPVGVLDRLVGLGDRAVLVRGNADRELLQMAWGEDVGLSGDPVSVWGAAQLTPAHLRLIEAMPEQVTLDVDGFGPVRFCHATPRDDAEVVLVDTRDARWRTVLRDLPDDVGTVVLGHTHMPFVRLVGGRTVVNSGSVGLPYGRSGAHWAVLADGAVTLGRTPLDPEELVAAVVATSRMPDVEAWAEENLRRPAPYAEAVATFGPRDGRGRESLRRRRADRRADRKEQLRMRDLPVPDPPPEQLQLRAHLEYVLDARRLTYRHEDRHREAVGGGIVSCGWGTTIERGPG
ncbi:metallophosphoesterase family protein [Litorihabitans aurantiacus]|uniref:Calcineurin-like phosphoesterase domain-containing protein n=1 Tax=Litorihabitans aurantiacus TaxID=1930061 RepID=A0AA37XG83_9MICO|nr:metallophosphoesterase family protein [Litorihabitans aurantiacus]GMA32983.1 hypothetical protein GCM10025875_29750 [Litorihabitans aurantiacus]